MMENVKLKGEWFFEEEGGAVSGPLFNSITSAGLLLLSQTIAELPSPYLVVGDDSAPGETIVEVLRKPVSTIIVSGSLIRFRTQILQGECNGDHTKAAIFIGGTDVAGSGTMLNLLTQPWSKAGNTVLTVEARITIAAEE
ncbi:hypothetical protein [Heliophilum fasciatum]|uniref:Uncharacterized protein n=1 Tax=Heliophilum fasciatum TaxID=35700 RepID=A0A4R2RK06_9FIRM|nr:hypothetical protein [Heliophilum fasciatum]MCW2278744.1 hypothetical protein [Heliophilum fasciatum]TCP62517.1 hypothetical protein EDD73_12115 [Heliophilum fasciatum]